MNDGTYSRVGETNEYKTNFQVVVASIKDLDDAVDDGTFLIDLRMRLTGIEINIPPLRERRHDFEDLIRIVFAKQAIVMDEKELGKIVACCQQYYWRGNVRQLVKVLQTMVVIAQLNDSTVAADTMPEYKTMLAPKQDSSHPEPRSQSSPMKDATDLLARSCHQDVPLEEVMGSIEKAVIHEALQRHSKLSDVYKGLAISRTNLDAKRRKHGLL